VGGGRSDCSSPPPTFSFLTRGVLRCATPSANLGLSLQNPKLAMPHFTRLQGTLSPNGSV
jgi:hypothetical protein